MQRTMLTTNLSRRLSWPELLLTILLLQFRSRWVPQNSSSSTETRRNATITRREAGLCPSIPHWWSIVNLPHNRSTHTSCQWSHISQRIQVCDWFFFLRSSYLIISCQIQPAQKVRCWWRIRRTPHSALWRQCRSPTQTSRHLPQPDRTCGWLLQGEGSLAWCRCCSSPQSCLGQHTLNIRSQKIGGVKYRYYWIGAQTVHFHALSKSYLVFVAVMYMRKRRYRQWTLNKLEKFEKWMQEGHEQCRIFHVLACRLADWRCQWKSTLTSTNTTLSL